MALVDDFLLLSIDELSELLLERRRQVLARMRSGSIGRRETSISRGGAAVSFAYDFADHEVSSALTEAARKKFCGRPDLLREFGIRPLNNRASAVLMTPCYEPRRDRSTICECSEDEEC